VEAAGNRRSPPLNKTRNPAARPGFKMVEAAGNRRSPTLNKTRNPAVKPGFKLVEGTTTYRKTVSKPALLVTP